MNDIKLNIDKDSLMYIQELKAYHKQKQALMSDLSKSKKKVYEFVVRYESLINGSCKEKYAEYDSLLKEINYSTSKKLLEKSKSEAYEALNSCTNGTTYVFERLINNSSLLDKFLLSQENICLSKCLPLLNTEKVYNKCLSRCVAFRSYGEISKYNILSSLV